MKSPRPPECAAPDDPREGSLLKDWSNVVLIKGVVGDTMAAIDRYTFPTSGPRYDNGRLSYSGRTFSYASTDVSTEDELDESEDGSISIGTSHLNDGTRQCQTRRTSGKWHMPRDCLVVSRCCRWCGEVGHLAKACSVYTHLKIPQPVQLTRTPDKLSPWFAYGSDEDSRVDDKSPTPVDIKSTTGSTDNSQYVYPESHKSQDSDRQRTKRWGES